MRVKSLSYDALYYEWRLAALDHNVLLVVNVLYLILLDHLDFLDNLQSQRLLVVGHQIHTSKGAAAQRGYLLQLRDGHLGVLIVELQRLVTGTTTRIVALTTGFLAQLLYGSQIANEGSEN